MVDGTTKYPYDWFKVTQLPTNEQHGKASCRVCTEYNQGSTGFATEAGATITTLNEVKRHHESAAHAAAVRKGMEKEDPTKNIRGGLQRTAQHVRAVVAGAVPVLFSVLLFVASNHLPIKLFVAQVALQHIIAPNSLPAGKYTHSRYFWGLLFALSEAVLQAQLQRVLASPFFGVLADSSTDISNENPVLLYVRYVDKATFKVFTEYLTTITVTDKTGAGIHAAISATLVLLGLPVDRMLGFGSDGERTYTGQNIGVVTLFKQEQPLMIAVHCVAHRNALCPATIMPRYPLLSTLDTVLRNVHALFNRSPNRTQEWEKYASARGVTKLRFPVFNDTRWYSRWQCVRVVCMNLVVLLSYLAEHKANWPKAAAVHKLLLKPNNVAMLFFMHDVLDIMQSLNCSFQKDSLLPHEVDAHVRQTIAALEVMLCEDGSINTTKAASYGTFLANLTTTGKWYYRRNDPSVHVQLKGAAFSKAAMNQFASSFVVELVAELKRRFLETGEVLDCFMVFHHHSYIHQNEFTLQKFGYPEFTKLLKHYNALCAAAGAQPEQVKHQFDFMRGKLYAASREMHHLSIHEVWQYFAQHHLLEMPIMFKFVHAMLVVPVQNAMVERGFHMHKLIKTRLRSTMRFVTMDSLMRVKQLVPVVDHNFIVPTALLERATELYAMQPTVRNALGHCMSHLLIGQVAGQFGSSAERRAAQLLGNQHAAPVIALADGVDVEGAEEFVVPSDGDSSVCSEGSVCSEEWAMDDSDDDDYDPTADRRQEARLAAADERAAEEMVEEMEGGDDDDLAEFVKAMA